MAKGSKYFRMADCGEGDEDALLQNFETGYSSPENSKLNAVQRSPWNSECIVRLLFLFVLSIMSIGFMIRFIPQHHGHGVYIAIGHEEHHHHNTFRKAAVAAGQLECSTIGKDILEAGGNAVDAAIATTLCQGVVESYYSGIGGGSAITIYNATTKSVTCITSREKAPAAATPTMYLNATNNRGAKFIAVPGELKGLWYAYDKYGGGVPWADLLEPSIRKAKLGYAISGSMTSKLEELYQEYLSFNLNSYFCEIFCNADKTGVKKAGDIVKNVKLAETLTRIQQYGVDDFYTGETARKIVKDIQYAGGIMTADDLKEYTIEEHPALVIPLKNAGYMIHAPPLPFGGAVFGAIMSIIDLYNITPSIYDANETLQWHRVDEAFRHSYGARYSMGDMNFEPRSAQTVNDIVSGKFANEAKKRIFDTKTSHDPKYYGAKFLRSSKTSTSHVSVLSPDKDAVSVTSTINNHFGAWVISPSTGIVFNNEMDDFEYPTGDPDHDSQLSPTNQIEGGKRPLSCMTPVVITDNVDHDPTFIIGAAGGKMIPTSVANVMLRLLYFTNDDFDDPIRARRIHDSLLPDTLEYEKGFDQDIIDNLSKIGHNVSLMDGHSHVNGIKYHTSHIHAFSDLRNKGAGVSVHIRLTIAPGSTIPDLRFKSEWGTDKDASEKVVFSSLADYHSNTLSGMDNTCISPMKPSKTKAEQPEEINVTVMSEADKKNVGSKLVGRRTYREVQVTTFENVENQGGDDATAIGQVTEDINMTENCTSEKSENAIQQVISKTTRQLLHRSSASSSRNKDDSETNSNISSLDGSQMSASSGKNTPTRVYSGSGGRSDSPSMPTTNASYFSGNPAVQITHGIIQLYKTNYMVNFDEDSRPPPTKMLCMLCIPASIDAHIILEFTSAFCDKIKRLQIIRDRTPNQYMVLMLFTSKKAAATFYSTYNGAVFNSLVEDVCHLAFVASVEALPSMHDSVASEAKGLLPIINSTELPDCVLCLERMDESVRGVLTILCNHSFHGSCLQKWQDLCCPVCRYLQTPEPESDNQCLVCGSLEDLWICLICGNVGCGRYTHEHAKQHYIDTHHNYAMALKDNRVWDYAGDYFVHRLFQNKEDGKLVEQKGSNDQVGDGESKVEAIQLECMYLLTSQLDSQRKHWEERLAKAEEIAASDRNAADSQLSDILRKLEFLEKEKSALEKRNQLLTSKYSASLRELTTEKELNNGLRKNQEEWRTKVQSLETVTRSQQCEIDDLKEQVRDLMFFLEAQKAVDGADKETKEDIQGGQIVLGAAGGQKKKRRSKQK